MRPVLLEVAARHDCFLVDTTEKMESRVTVVDAREDGNDLICIARITSSNLDAYFKLLDTHPYIHKVEPLFREDNKAVVRFTGSSDGTFHKAVFDSKCFLAEPTLSTDGEDFVTLFAPSHKNVNELFNNFDESYETKIIRKRTVKKADLRGLNFFSDTGFLKLKSMNELLTPRQREVLEFACKKGYYGYPKKVTLTDLSDQMGIEETTFRKHLRKAEQKVIPVFSEIMKKI